MTELVWHLHGRGFALDTARDIASRMGLAMKARGRAVVAFPGGSTPAPIFECLPREPFPWNRVTLLPTDERDVAASDPLSNEGALRAVFQPLGAHVLPLAAADTLDLPLDLAWLGMGEDGHTASLFPGPDLETAFSTEAPVVAVRPDPLPAGAAVARHSLSAHALASAREILVTITGATKRAVLEAAIAGAPLPIGRLLRQTSSPVHVHWCP
jgi:6-phosphogluconolactonase